MRMTGKILATLRALRATGLSYVAVAKEIGCDPRTVAYHTDEVWREKHKRRSLNQYYERKQKEAAE